MIFDLFAEYSCRHILSRVFRLQRRDATAAFSSHRMHSAPGAGPPVWAEPVGAPVKIPASPIGLPAVTDRGRSGAPSGHPARRRAQADGNIRAESRGNPDGADRLPGGAARREARTWREG